MVKKAILILVAVLVVSLVACAKPAPAPTPAPAPAPTPAPAPKPIEWRVRTHNTPGSLGTQLYMHEVPKRMLEATGGRLKIIELPEIVKDVDIIDAVQAGRFDGGSMAMTYVASGFCPANIINLPLMFDDQRDKAKWEEQVAYMETIRAEMRRQFDIVPVGVMYWGSQWVLSKDPLRTADDFKGKKIRAYGTLAPKILSHLGASVVTMPFGDVFLALQTGMIEGVFTGIQSAYGSRFHDMAKYENKWEVGGFGEQFYAISSRTWDALPDDLKPIVEGVYREIWYENRDQIYDIEVEYLKKMEADGVEVIYPAAEELAKMIPPAIVEITKWRQQCEEVGFKIPKSWEEYMRSRGIWAD